MKTDAADRRTPTSIRIALAEYGGFNRYGGANWRAVVAEEHLVQRGGIFKTMPSGNVQSFELDPETFKMTYHDIKPEKVETGLKMVPRWPCRGWVLERWFPPETRSRVEWESAKSSDGITPMMGPYPEEGDYFMLAGPWEQLPDIQDLKNAISMHIRMENEQPAGYKQMLLEELNKEDAEREAQYEKAVADLAHFYESEVEPVMKGSSLEASRIRQELAAKMGDFSHQGIA